MFKFRSPIYRPAAAPAGMTNAQWFRSELAKGLVPAMLKGIKAAKRDTRIIVAGVLAITYQHQAHWLTTIDGIDNLGWFIPAVIDLAMLRMLGIVQLGGIKSRGMIAALVMTGVLVAMSATLNVAAPGELAAKLVFGALTLIAGGVKVVTAMISPDPDKMEADETAAAPTAATRKLSPEVAAERAAKAAITKAENARKRMTRGQKAADTRRRNSAAPVSPAWAIEGRTPTAAEATSITA